MIERRSFRESDLQRIGPPAMPWPAQPGSFVRLRSGSPLGVIVQIFPTGAGWHGRASVSWVGAGPGVNDDQLSVRCLDPAIA